MIRARQVMIAATLALSGAPVFAQNSAIVGKVIESDTVPVFECPRGCPLPDANVHAVRSDGTAARDVVTGADGSFRIGALTPGLYTVTVRRVGYRNAELAAVRVAVGQTVGIEVRLTKAPRRLSTIQVVASPMTINATTPEMSVQLDREFTQMLPTARDASSLISLVPGARKDQLWGAAPGVANDYQLDGVSMNHPGFGGDFLSLSVDWVETVDVRGLGVGAEHGNFQGGIINAITKTGGNDRRHALRTNYESAALTASNFNANEEGVEQAGRRELSGELLGPIARDRLFYFVAGQFVSRDMRSPNLTTTLADDFQPQREQHSDGRAVGKLTWLPALGQRVDLLAGFTSNSADHAGINGVDDPSSTLNLRQPSAFYELTWNNSSHANSEFDVRIAGFNSRETRFGQLGGGVPGVQVLQLGRMPTYQNSAFNETREPSSIGLSAQWSGRQRVIGVDHRLVVGGDISRGRWRNERTRNGNVTWRPYSNDAPNFDPNNALSWKTIASDWGGELRFDSDVGNEALFLQDYATLTSRVTITPGLRVGHWVGYVHPQCSTAVVTAGTCYRFQAVDAKGLDPRLGLAWDVTGHNTLAVKAHWGRYHQGMFALFFDRAVGANAYTNQRTYYSAPPLTDSRTSFTPDQRDSLGSGFTTLYEELILNEEGRVKNYRQPYVDQAVLGIEKSIGASWKMEVTYTNRRNGDIVGLMDRNLMWNYTPLHDVAVNHRLFPGFVIDANGNDLVLPDLYVSNKALLELLARSRTAPNPPAKLFGYDTAYIGALTWNPDVTLGAVPQAWRHYNQITTMLRTYHPSWRGEASVTFAQLKGNVAGVTGYGTTGTTFSAGPFVRRNEAINMEGTLPDALQMEAKTWFTARLPYKLQGGLVFTHILGERFTPSFRILGRYSYVSPSAGGVPDELLKDILGQTMFVEERGSRNFASRDVVDTHLEWQATRAAVLTFDVFNVGGANALVDINTNIGDQDPSDLTSQFAAPRLRVAPRTLRVGLRIE